MRTQSLFKNLILLALLGTLGAACSKKTSDDTTAQTATPAPMCTSMDGTWINCQNNGDGTSTRISLVFSGNGTALNETIQNFNSNALCAGADDGSFAFAGSVVLGPIGGSTYLAGATDAQITPSGADLGCGNNTPIYSMFKLAGDCQSFMSSASGATCSASSVSTSMTNGPFLKQ